MEFHIARRARDRYEVSSALFTYTGNAIFANVAASRALAARVNEVRQADTHPDQAMHAASLFAMGLIDELSHALIARYRETLDPRVLPAALQWFTTQLGDPSKIDKLLLQFATEFPTAAVYQNELTPAQWLAGSSDGMLHREAAFEEMLLLWLENQNPAFQPFAEFFDEVPLAAGTAYRSVTAQLDAFFSTRPVLDPEIGTLLDALRAPMLASPDSLTGQLEFIREKWVDVLGDELHQVLLAIDLVKEEDIAIWMRFHPASDSASHPEQRPGFAHGFEGDEFTGFGGEWYTDAQGQRRFRSTSGAAQQPTVNEYEAFSADEDWMPTVVLIAKSTYVWLEQLSKKYGRHIHRLDQIPQEEFQLLADRGLNGLWLIGLWERSISSQTIKRMRGQADAVASAYSVADYRIADDLGGESAYRHLRDQAAAAGIRLASDMVPNHMGIDSTWVMEHPEWFLSRPESPFPVYSFGGPDLSPNPAIEIKIEDHYFDQTDAAVVFRRRDLRSNQTDFLYHGNDGTTFAWNDTAQLDYSKAFVREQVMQTILQVARLFPIIRFDAAMTLAKKHVQRLWFPMPGVGGSIPSRAESAISNEEFDALMPNEFWREVVDRVAVEVPGTLLLAEAFWLLEGYFVRTLGMHRVYNSAFMNMIRDEENAKYRSYLKKTIEFDPDILKRYVNFMSNPDERTAIDQFGSGDRYFGACTLLATLPGLPMFGHGQIEAFTEKYGMEYKTAKFEEWPNEDLVGRHQREIAPLLKNRQLFAGSTDFFLYDLWTEHGTVDENVFAYSNRSWTPQRGEERAIIFFNNRYGSTRGTIHTSAESMDKGSGELRSRQIHHALGLRPDDNLVIAYKDTASGLEYLRRATDIAHHGLTVELRAYQYLVLLHWRELRSTAEQPWDRLCDALHGAGVYNLEEALSRLRLRPLHEAFRHLLSHATVEELRTAAAVPGAQAPADSSPAVELEAGTEHGTLAAAPPTPSSSSKTTLEAGTEKPNVETVPINGQAASEPPPSRATAPTSHLPEGVLNRITSLLHQLHELGSLAVPAAAAHEQLDAALQHLLTVPAALGSALKQTTPHATPQHAVPDTRANPGKAAWPEAGLALLPGPHSPAAVWAPAAAWATISALASDPFARTALFDQLLLRAALAEIFPSFGFEGDAAWRAATRVRILLAHTGTQTTPAPPLSSEAFWADPDVRWLAGVTEHQGRTYINKELFTELVCWLQLPALATGDAPADVPLLLDTAEKAGYEVGKLRILLAPPLDAAADIEVSEEPLALPANDAPAPAKLVATAS